MRQVLKSDKKILDVLNVAAARLLKKRACSAYRDECCHSCAGKPIYYSLEEVAEP